MAILSQDKGRAIVLEDLKVYEEKMSWILNPPNVEEEEKTYISLKNDPTKSVKRKITEKLKTLKDDGKHTYQQYMELKPKSETILRIYGLLKVYKNPSDPPYRPIMDYTGCCTYKVARAACE